MSIRFLAALFLFPFIAISCSSATSPAVTEMEFSVDSTLADRVIIDSILHVSYRVPSAWNNLHTPDISSAQQAAGVSIHNILKKADSSVIFSLTDIRKVPDSVIKNLDEHYQVLLNPSNTWTSVNKADFVSKGFTIKQFMMSAPALTNFKLLFFQNKRPDFQIDYTITVDSLYQQNTKILESILGSLQTDQ
jgi:hypothetical protein